MPPDHSGCAPYAVFSAGPLEEILEYREFMGWKAPWYSSADSGSILKTTDGGDLRRDLRDSDQVYLTYESKRRGIEPMLATLQLLDLTPFGRQESWEAPPPETPPTKSGSWWRRDGRPIAQWLRTNEPVEK